MQALGGSPAEGREPRSCGKIGCAGDALDEMFARPWEEGSSSLLQREPKKSSERQMARCKANVFVARTSLSYLDEITDLYYNFHERTQNSKRYVLVSMVINGNVYRCAVINHNVDAMMLDSCEFEAKLVYMDSPSSKVRELLQTSNLDCLWVSASSPSAAVGSLYDDHWTRH
ncbi:hypothetical protein H671_1g3653 [Cricetulus griseus]|nr:hypothetical protein H671_1g3653 [Cricetulus griseus]